MLPPSLRPMRLGDLEPVLDLWQALMNNGFAADLRYEPAADARAQFRPYVKERWVIHQPFVSTWVAEVGGQLIGFCGGIPLFPVPVLANTASVRIGDLYVAPDSRRQGLGRQLVAAFLQGARSAGHTRFEVGTLAHDAQAIAFWRAMGFADLRVTLQLDR